MDAVATKIANYPAFSTTDVAHDREYMVPIESRQAVTVIQGVDDVVQQLDRYVDSILEFSIDLQVKVVKGTRPATLINALAVGVVKALTPRADGSVGVLVASNLTEIGITDVTIDDGGEEPSAYATMNWTIQYRRDTDDPENLTP